MKRSLGFTLYFCSIVVFCSCNNQIPDDVTLNAITQDPSGIQLSWSQSNDGDFSSYKLYRHSTSGIDNSTGELIHISTSVADVSFTDVTFDPQETYYYRLYVFSDNGISNGSNIESITTETVSLITNGSFETGTTSWVIVPNDLFEPANSITIDATTASDGAQSLKFNHVAVSGCYDMTIEQYVSLGDITPGGTYEFSFDYKSDAVLENNGMGFRLENNSMYLMVPIATFQGDGVWHTSVLQFTLPTDIGTTDPNIMIHFCFAGTNIWWIDNVSVIKV